MKPVGFDDTPPPHPQPGFYELVIANQGFDPETCEEYSHEKFMQDANQEGWLGLTLLDFERRTGKFDTTKRTRTRTPRQKGPRR